MRNNLIIQIAAKALLLLLIIPATVFAQLKITFPAARAVYQRDISGQRTVPISGTFSIEIDKIEVRAVPVILGQGVEQAWKTLVDSPKGGVFYGGLTLYGGWYTIEIRGIKDGNVVARDVLERLGVGEVFLISGQSNAQGLKKYPGPGATDDRVIYITNGTNDEVDRLTDPAPPIFAKVTTDLEFMSPRGQSAWCWGMLGDRLVSQLNVPVLFINTAWEGTSVVNWAESADGKDTYNRYGGFKYPFRMPYANLMISAKNYANQFGVRAILWMQGETDGAKGTDPTLYRESLQHIINKIQSDTGKRITWMIARTSRTSEPESAPAQTYPAIIAAQNAVIDTPFNPTYPGPETDPLVPLRLPDHTHFVGVDALTILADAWYKSMDAQFFAEAPPVAPSLMPQITATCTTDNNGVTITLPTGYASYTWSNGSTGNSIRVTAAGTYRATVKDAFGNSTLSPVVVLEGNAKPSTPIIEPSGDQQACADSAFTFSVAANTDIFKWYDQSDNSLVATGIQAKIAETGNYYVQRQNVFGCVSNISEVRSLTIRPQIPAPVIESSGPFSITANIATPGLNESYIWNRPGMDTDTTANIIKVLKSGKYTAKAKVDFNLNGNILTCYSDTASRDFKTNEKNEVVIYPNPSQESFIYIEARDAINDADISLFDIKGRLVKSMTTPILNSRAEINITNMPAGKYLIRVTGEGQSLTKQIVIR
ncbi:putative secreted protein (Por secretion system target) [Dyadobacter jejuensis]|uniref:Putative secreted protein (Por secretion system target) n=1 Tax=Dyadobacter jejuensis TaxID=1082580 RepID=A0A316ARC7_9BACT|nr:sialate O-acetylesterase [Dyadobacter jejuensis]PWJ59991.1 putative secreted protein (Por secretion system target) [Dyadobacter jejuensis]